MELRFQVRPGNSLRLHVSTYEVEAIAYHRTCDAS